MMRTGAAILALALSLAAQQPPVSNADLRSAAASAGLEAAIRSALANQTGPVWIGYAVPKVPGEHDSCCWNNDIRGCGLEGQRTVAPARSTAPVLLEGPTHAPVLLRYEQGALSKVRVVSMDCTLDAGGLPFYWLTGVNPTESIVLLSGFIQAKGKAAESVLHAIAMHRAPEADAVLEKTAAGPEESLRRKALFWLGILRGRRGFEVVERAAREHPSEKTREHAVFALSRSKEKDAVAAIVRIAKEDQSPRVRGQALFWLGQKASSAEVISEAIEKDPDTEVKKKAVFALSQLPKDEGVPKLIQIARTNRNPAVRKQAMFWLAQSKDPRALDYFEQVLGK
jgi:hypothetical protein